MQHSSTMEDTGFDSTTVGVYRTSATVKGGRRFSFAALVVVGDRSGKVGMGYSKANQVPLGVEKATKEARRKMVSFPLQSRTIPHSVEGRFGASTVRLVPASPGTGVIAGASVRAVLEMLGVRDCLTKCYGSSNPKNVVKATFAALEQLQTRERVEALRGVTLGATSVEDSIVRGMAGMPAQRSGPRAQGPVNTVADDRRGGRGRGRGRRHESGPGGGPGASSAPPAAPPADNAPQS